MQVVLGAGGRTGEQKLQFDVLAIEAVDWVLQLSLSDRSEQVIDQRRIRGPECAVRLATVQFDQTRFTAIIHLIVVFELHRARFADQHIRIYQRGPRQTSQVMR